MSPDRARPTQAPQRRLRVVAIAGAYPTDARPWPGVPIEEHARHLVGSGKGLVSVLAAVPWIGSPFGHRDAVPFRERRFGISIDHPRHLVPAAFGRRASARSIVWATLPILRQRLARGVDFDVLEAHGAYPDGVVAVALGRAFRKPAVIVIRDGDALLGGQAPAFVRHVVASVAGADRIVATSGALRSRLLAAGLPADRTVALRDGVDLTRFRMSGHKTTKAKLQLAGTIWLAVGRLVRARRVELAIGALADAPDATLLVLGDGPDEARLRQLAVRLHADNRIHFLGSVSHNQLPRYYNAADALLHTADGEGISNSVLECLACGTPVVAAPSAGIAEVLTDPAAGAIAGTADAAGLAAAWRSLVARLPARMDTRTFAEAFGWDHATAERCALYWSIVAARTDPSATLPQGGGGGRAAGLAPDSIAGAGDNHGPAAHASDASRRSPSS